MKNGEFMKFDLKQFQPNLNIFINHRRQPTLNWLRGVKEREREQNGDIVCLLNLTVRFSVHSFLFFVSSKRCTMVEIKPKILFSSEEN